MVGDVDDKPTCRYSVTSIFSQMIKTNGLHRRRRWESRLCVHKQIAILHISIIQSEDDGWPLLFSFLRISCWGKRHICMSIEDGEWVSLMSRQNKWINDLCYSRVESTNRAKDRIVYLFVQRKTMSCATNGVTQPVWIFSPMQQCRLKSISIQSLSVLRTLTVNRSVNCVANNS